MTDDVTSFDKKNINSKIKAFVKEGYVYLRGVPSDVQITVTDISGKHLMVQKTLRNFNSEVALDLRNISNGFYIIQVKGKNLQKRIKISKK